MHIEQSELYDNVLVSKFCSFLKRYKTLKKRVFFEGGGGGGRGRRGKNIFKKTGNSHHVSRPTLVDF